MKSLIHLLLITLSCLKGYCEEELHSNETTTEKIEIIDSVSEDIDYKEDENNALDSEELLSASDHTFKMDTEFNNLSDIIVTEVSVTEEITPEEVIDNKETKEGIKEDLEITLERAEELQPEIKLQSKLDQRNETSNTEETQSKELLVSEIFKRAPESQSIKLDNRSEASAKSASYNDSENISSKIHETDRISFSENINNEKKLDELGSDIIIATRRMFSSPNTSLDVKEKTSTSTAAEADVGTMSAVKITPSLNLKSHNNYQFGLDSISKSMKPLRNIVNKSQNMALTSPTISIKSKPFMANLSSQEISTPPSLYAKINVNSPLLNAEIKGLRSAPLKTELKESQIQPEERVLRFQNPQTFTKENVRFPNLINEQRLKKNKVMNSKLSFKNKDKKIHQEQLNRGPLFYNQKKVDSDFEKLKFQNKNPIQQFQNTWMIDSSQNPFLSQDAKKYFRQSYLNQAFGNKNRENIMHGMRNEVHRKKNKDSKIPLENGPLNKSIQERNERPVSPLHNFQIQNTTPWPTFIQNVKTTNYKYVPNAHLSTLFLKLDEASKHPHKLNFLHQDRL